jgi:hypothetical protein
LRPNHHPMLAPRLESLPRGVSRRVFDVTKARSTAKAKSDQLRWERPDSQFFTVPICT